MCMYQGVPQTRGVDRRLYETSGEDQRGVSVKPGSFEKINGEEEESYRIMTFQELKQLVTDQFPEAILGEDLNATPQALLVAPEAIHAVCAWLHAGEKTYFDSLSCLTGLDNGPRSWHHGGNLQPVQHPV